MPIPNRTDPIRESQVKTTEGDAKPAEYTEDAVATLVWDNYNEARNYVENNAWLLEWQEADVLYQDPTPDRFARVQNGRPGRLSQFLVAKFTRTEARAVKRALFAEQIPFMLRPVGQETQEQVDAWTALIAALLKRMKFQYHVGLLIDSQTLQGTGIGKLIWQTKTVIKKKRRRKNPPESVTQPDGSKKVIHTAKSDEFEVVEDKIVESWPKFEYRRLGTTLFDPKWCTPDHPELCGYAIDIDYVTFADLQVLRQLDCYINIPSDEALKQYLFSRNSGAQSAPVGSSVEDSFSAQGSMVTHAEGRNRQTDRSPLAQPMMLFEQWDSRTVKAVLIIDDRKYTIRNEEHGMERECHVSGTWWPIESSGYGMGIGRIAGWVQRLKKGMLNEGVKTVAFPLNAPILVRRGENAPTQNTIWRMGGYQQVDANPGEDVQRAMAFMKMPEVPADVWKFMQMAVQDGEQLTGASQQFQQGNLGGPGSSAARTATGASRIAGMSDQSVADPVDSIAEGVIVPTIEFLMDRVKEDMPLEEIRKILSKKHAAIIEDTIQHDQFLNCEFEVTVLAGQKLQAKQGIQTLIPFFLQIVQQPQLLEFLHQKGQTIDFAQLMDILLQVSELVQQPNIFRTLTPDEQKAVKESSPGLQKIQAAMAVEQQKGENTKEAIQTKGETDLGVKAAEMAMAKTSEGIPLARATGLAERSADEDALKNGLPETMKG